MNEATLIPAEACSSFIRPGDLPAEMVTLPTHPHASSYGVRISFGVVTEAVGVSGARLGRVV